MSTEKSASRSSFGVPPALFGVVVFPAADAARVGTGFGIVMAFRIDGPLTPKIDFVIDVTFIVTVLRRPTILSLLRENSSLPSSASYMVPLRLGARSSLEPAVVVIKTTAVGGSALYFPDLTTPPRGNSRAKPLFGFEAA